MRPLFHPAIEDITVEGILHALSDPVRVEIYKDLASKGWPQTCTEFLAVSAQAKPIPKSTLSQHFKVLREAGLVHSVRNGVEMHNTTRCEELEGRFPGLIAAIIRAHTVQLMEWQRAARAATAADVAAETERQRVLKTGIPTIGIPEPKGSPIKPHPIKTRLSKNPRG